MRRFTAISLAAVLLTASTALAADDDAKALMPGASVAAALAHAGEPFPVTFTPGAVNVHRPALLPALYASTAALQGYDAYSTLTALSRGGVEQNPLMKGVVKSPTAFVALKAGMATASIMAAEQMWKRNNRAGAIITMLASNSLMAMVAAHNARVLGRIR